MKFYEFEDSQKMIFGAFKKIFSKILWKSKKNYNFATD